MALNFTSTETLETAPDLRVTAAPVDASLKQAIALSPPEVPKELLGVSAGKMPPMTAAGLFLAKFVLWIATATIVAFIGYLFWIDNRVGSDVLEEYTAVSYRTVPAAEAVDTGILQRYLENLTSAKSDQRFVLDAGAQENANSFLKIVGQLATLSPLQKTQLGQCQPLPIDSDRLEKLDLCILITNSIRQDVIDAKAARSAKFAEDELDRLASQRKSVHDFWLQAAQLILLNLLLPLLTALFGYIFGTQSAAHGAQSQ